MQDFSKVNANDFTQKDLMLHLLNVTQHSATREDVKSDILELSSQVDKRFEQVDKRFEQVDKRFDKVEAKIDKVDVKFDRLQWLIVATIVTVLGKDYIFSLF
jgi:uncharacterized protein (DUF111 family)